MDIREKLSLFKINKYFILFFLVCFIAGYLKDAVLFFLFVLLHELSHGVAAHFCGLKIRGIELFPFGGIAKVGGLDYMGVYKEIIVSTAGPLFNIVMAVFLLLLKKLNIIIPYYDTIFGINVVLAVFNLLPGFPLDGGRIFRAVLNYYIGFKKATRTAVISGKVISAVLLLTGFILLLYGKINISFFVMPVFMIYAANQEESTMVFMMMKDMIAKGNCLKDKGIMESKPLCVFEDMYVGDILKYVDIGIYHVIYVIGSNMEIEGILTESQIIDNLEAGDVTIGQINHKINGIDKYRGS